MRRGIASVIALVLASAAIADEAAVRRMMEAKLAAGGRVESVARMPGAGLFEVVIRGADGPQIYYVDERASVLVIGQAFDARSGRNLTEERMRKLSAIRWDVLPFQWAITDRRGNGRRKIAIFSDPNCPYCKRFEEDLAKLDDITVHIFPYAVIKPESVRQAKAVWCSKDRLRAWNDLMFRRIQPAAAPDCDTPVEKLVEYGRGVGASSTPTWFLETGERYSGALPLDRVRALLDTASPVKR
jgi:thiol:disulfide interchange protein DsbC